MAEKLAAVGWQGITLKAPPDWSLVGVSGDDKKGYFRVDSPVSSAIEVRWSPAQGKAPDLMTRGREFLANVEKACRKKKIRFSSKIRPDRDNSVDFVWRADRLGQGRLLYCAGCDRVIIAQVVSSREESVSHIAPVMLDSLTDHRPDGWVNWALYGMQFAVPAGYRVDKQSLMSGYLMLSFKSRAKTLVVERWGLASSLLAEYGFEQWYRKDVMPDIKGYRVEVKAGDVGGFEGLVVKGVRSGLRQAVKAAAYSLTLHPHPKYLTGYAWHQPESNRLFAVRATHAEGEDIADKARDSIFCGC